MQNAVGDLSNNINSSRGHVLQGVDKKIFTCTLTVFNYVACSVPIKKTVFLCNILG